MIQTNRWAGSVFWTLVRSLKLSRQNCWLQGSLDKSRKECNVKNSWEWKTLSQIRSTWVNNTKTKHLTNRKETVKWTNEVNNKNIWRNKNIKKKRRNEKMKKWNTLGVLLKKKQELFKHEIKKSHFLKCKKFFRTFQVTSWNVRKKVENYKFQKDTNFWKRI